MPQPSCGKVERFHQTLKKWLTDALQAALSDWDTASHFCVAAVEDMDANEVRHTGEFIQPAARRSCARR
ncbi:MAG: hypothetical protein ACLP9Y_24795 [Mycobacterium sp.]